MNKPYSEPCPIEPHGTLDAQTGELTMYGNLSDVKRPKAEYIEQDDGKFTVMYRVEDDHE